MNYGTLNSRINVKVRAARRGAGLLDLSHFLTDVTKLEANAANKRLFIKNLNFC